MDDYSILAEGRAQEALSTQEVEAGKVATPFQRGQTMPRFPHQLLLICCIVWAALSEGLELLEASWWFDRVAFYGADSMFCYGGISFHLFRVHRHRNKIGKTNGDV
eukprot:1614199-Amphidinium_carterae.1